MKKSLILIILPILLLATGCASVSKDTRKLENKTTTSNNFVFQDESYSLTLPADFQVEPGAGDGFIRPKIAGSFSPIRLGLMASKESPSTDDILKEEKIILANLCGQTEGCGEITKWESTEIEGKTAAKFTVQYTGRRTDDPNGYIVEYHYSIPHIKYEYDALKYPQDQNKYPYTYIFQFSASVNDQENPEQQEAVFDTVMKTIVFK